MPGSINSKNGDSVRIIQKWDGNRPPIQWITEDYLNYLIQKRSDKINERKQILKRKKSFNSKFTNTNKIQWIENLLTTHRKYCLWSILGPYLLNVKSLLEDKATRIMEGWSIKCDNLKKLDFRPKGKIKPIIKGNKGYLSILFEGFRDENGEI